MTFEGAQQPTRSNLPQPNRVVITTRSLQFAIRGKADRIYFNRMPILDHDFRIV